MKQYLFVFALSVLLAKTAKADEWKATWPRDPGTNNYDATVYIDKGDWNWGDFPVYNDKVFAIFPNAPAFLYREYDEFRTQYNNPGTFSSSERRIVKPMYKVDGGSYIGTLSVPSTSNNDVGLHQVQIASYWQYIKGGSVQQQSYTVYKTFNYIVEAPAWQDVEEIKRICNNSTKAYLLSDLFTVKGATFYLDDITSSPVTTFTALGMTPGFHKLIAKKYYDNAKTVNSLASGGDLLIEYSFEVLASTPVTVSAYPASVCKNSSLFTISASPVNGAWSGNGIDNNGNFNPSAATIGKNNLAYSYTNSVTGCMTTKLIEVEVKDIPKVTLDQTGFSLCQSVTSYKLPAASPAGGAWSAEDAGYFTSPSLVNPSKTKAGPNVFIYTYSDGSCPNNAAFILTVNERPKLVIMNDFFSCTNGAKVALTAQPSGGFWQGEGIDNNQGAFFDPSVMKPGVSSLTYTYTDANSCTNTAAIKATVVTSPKVTVMNDTAICETSGTLALKGAPTGGVWSGQGVVGSNFDPKKSNTGN